MKSFPTQVFETFLFFFFFFFLQDKGLGDFGEDSNKNSNTICILDLHN